MMYVKTSIKIRQMKKIKKLKLFTPIIMSCFIILGAIFQSCEKEEIDYKLDIPEEYNEVGKLHNQGLEHIYEELKKETIALMKEKETTSLKNTKTLDYKAIVINSTTSFCESNNKMRNHIHTYEKSIDLASKRIYSASLKSKSLKDQDIPELNEIQNYFIKMIINEIGKKYKEKEIGKLKKSLEKINQMAKYELTEEEALVIYCVSSTAYNSYQYWIKNYKKWYFTINYPEIIENYKDEELNNLKLKNNKLVLKSSSNNSWWSSTWNSVESWWDETTDDISDWWDENGEEVVIGDIVGAGYGAATGAYSGAAAGATTGMIFGPGGAVLGGGGGAISGAVVGAVTQGAIGSGLGAVGTFIDLW